MPARHNSVVFEPGHIGALQIKNRLVRSATYENAATPEGEVSDNLISIYSALAKGGAGLIITGICGVYPKALAPHLMMRVDEDRFIPGLNRLSGAVHKAAPDSRIMLQLHHPGRQVMDPAMRARLASKLAPAWVAAFQKRPTTATAPEAAPHIIEPTAPSALHDTLFDRIPRALRLAEIEEIINAFAEGIRRAEEAGFDGVQLHAAHGWLLDCFLSPRTNRRDDIYGGSTENRTRIITEIFRRARKKVSADFPILIKFNSTDFLPGGIDPDEAVKVARILSETGFAALEVSGGMWETVTRSEKELGWPPVLLPESRTGIKSVDQEGYFLDNAQYVRKHVDAAVIAVGGFKSFSKIEKALTSKAADFISLSRPFIREPDLANRWRAGDGLDRAACISCNACLPLADEPLTCRAKSDKKSKA